MAGASLIRRETTMSAVTISHPAVFTPRPYRAQSARLLISQNRDLTTNRGYITNEVFPDIQSLSISHASGSIRAVETDQGLKESNFPNFRLLQRLAASAKARISSNSVKSQRKLASQEDEISKWNNCLLRSTEEDTTIDAVNTTVTSSRTEQILSPANEIKDVNGSYKVRRSKSRRRQSKFKTKKPGKQQSHAKRNVDKAASNHHLQPSTNKVIPTFSQRFTKHRRSNHQTFNSSQSSDKSSVALQFSLTAYPEYSNSQKPKDSISDSEDAFRKGDEQKIGSNVIQEAKLRAIYSDASQGATVSATSDGLNKVRLKKVFQSEKQSGYITQCGRLLPCAPPTSPTPLVLEKYEIIPSLADLRSQQSIKQRLTALDKENKKKRLAEDQEKKRKERQLLQTQFETQRVRNRQEIYALNKIMTKLEKEHFKRFQEKLKNR